MAEQRYVLGIAYQAGQNPLIAKGADGARDFFTAEELEKAAWSFMKNRPVVGLFHTDGTEGHFQVTESYIYRGPDWPMGDVIVKSGDWLIGGLCDEPAWRLVKERKVTGFSPQGVARRRRTARSAA